MTFSTQIKKHFNVCLSPACGYKLLDAVPRYSRHGILIL